MATETCVKNNEKNNYIQENSEAFSNEYTRVTTILYPFSGLTSIPPHILAHAADRGTRVHNACEAIVKGLGVWDIDSEISGYVKSFEKWWEKGHKVLTVEERFFCEEMKITGQVDMILETDDGAVILDIKTSAKPSKTWPLQGSAYAYMAKMKGYDIKGIQFLHLSKHGIEPKIYEYEDQFDLFKKCFDVYKYFFEKKKRKKKS